VYEGILNGTRVSIKRVRVYSKGDPETAAKVCYRRHSTHRFPLLTSSQTLYQEAVVWKRLTHPNIVPLLGITPTPLQLVSEWMTGGSLAEYIKKNPDTDRLGLVGTPLVMFTLRLPRYQSSDIAKGLCYLHSCNVIHGDLKGVRGWFNFSFATTLTCV